MTVSIANEPCLLKGGRRDSHTGTARAEHHRKVFVRESNLIGVDAIVRQQKPTCASFVDAMHPIACGELPQHVNVSLKKSVKQTAKLVVPAAEQSSKIVAADDDSAARNLAVTFVSRGRCSEQ
jgi:hypothetical protein